MREQSATDDAPGTRLFPQFVRLHPMVSAEVADLTDQQLDWQSDRWEWSIRRQVSHIAAFIPSWLLKNWGEQLFPEGLSQLGDLADYSLSPAGSWLDETKYWAISALLEQVEQATQLAQYVLARETVGSMRQKELARPGMPPHWTQFARAHPTGVRWHETEPSFAYLTLEATFRYLYFEVITHLYNVQRLKRAQGLDGTVELPSEGYWALPDWDRSEP